MGLHQAALDNRLSRHSDRSLSMSARSIGLTDALYDYLLQNSLREPAVLAELRAETAAMPDGGMQISPEQGQFMRLLVRLTGARACVEVGTFTGYSALSVALALPDDGKLVCCDVSEDFTSVARRYWAKAGVADKIELRLAPALESLDALIKEGGAGRYDLAFVDADKKNYDGYYERCLTLLRAGGLLLVDNVLWDGAVADPKNTDKQTIAIRRLNAKMQQDERIDVSMLPVGDGLTLARKR